MLFARLCLFFFFNDTATTEIYTLSLHDALPISRCSGGSRAARRTTSPGSRSVSSTARPGAPSSGNRSEEHTSELQSRLHLVCRLLLEKKKMTVEGKPAYVIPRPISDRRGTALNQ